MQLDYARLGQTFALGGDVAENDKALFAGAVKVFAAHLKIAEQSVEYLLQYGFSQSLQDCVAGRAKVVKDELIEAASKDKKPAPTEAEIDAAVKADELGRIQKRVDAIVAGTIGDRATGPRDVLAGVAREMVKAALAKQNKKATKEKFAELVADLLTIPEKRANVQKEFDRRAKINAAVAIDLD